MNKNTPFPQAAEVPSSPCAQEWGRQSGRSQALEERPEDQPETTYPERLRGAPLTGGSEAGDSVMTLQGR